MNTTVGLLYGIISEPISEQLKKQNLKFNPDKISEFEKEIEAINILRWGSGLLTDSMVDKILPKLHKKIIAHVAKANKMSPSAQK